MWKDPSVVNRTGQRLCGRSSSSSWYYDLSLMCRLQSFIEIFSCWGGVFGYLHYFEWLDIHSESIGNAVHQICFDLDEENTKGKIHINDDLPKELHDRRAVLRLVFAENKELGIPSKLSGDKITANKTTYDFKNLDCFSPCDRIITTYHFNNMPQAFGKVSRLVRYTIVQQYVK